ncbi:MAG: hypothetical protein IJ228_00300 [Succinivibrio sp.]|nr:hypothetical protein [Succinivibrio sp.]
MFRKILLLLGTLCAFQVSAVNMSENTPVNVADAFYDAMVEGDMETLTSLVFLDYMSEREREIKLSDLSTTCSKMSATLKYYKVSDHSFSDKDLEYVEVLLIFKRTDIPLVNTIVKLKKDKAGNWKVFSY